MRRLLALVPILLFAACGDDSSGPSGDPIAVLTAAPEATVEEETARVAFTIDMSIAGKDLTMEAEGIYDFDQQRMSMEMDMGEVFEQAGAPAGLDGAMEIVGDGTTMYMRMPMLSALGMPGVDEDTWLRIDLEDAAAQTGLDLGQLTGSGMNDPRQGLAMLTGAADVREVGRDEVRGEGTTHYQGTVDFEKAAREQGGIVDEEAFQRFLDMYGDTVLDVDAWIDDEGRARRVDFEMPLPAMAGSGDATISMEFFDFGVDADIAIPEDAIDAADVMPGMGGMGGMGGSGGMPDADSGY